MPSDSTEGLSQIGTCVPSPAQRTTRTLAICRDTLANIRHVTSLVPETAQDIGPTTSAIYVRDPQLWPVRTQAAQ